MSTNIQSVSTPRSGEGTWLWLFKIVTGILLVVLLFIHLMVNHFLSQHGLMNYADIVAYYQNPIIPIMEVCLLAAVVFHSLTGLRGIILDLKPALSLLKVIDAILVTIGVVAVVYGIWLVTVIASRG